MKTAGRRPVFIICLLAAAALSVTFWTDRMIFVFPARGDEGYTTAITDYIICKIIAFAVIAALFYAVFILVRGEGEARARLTGIIKCAAVYIPVMAVILIIKLPEGFLSNDEYSICANAVHLVHDTWFNYMTVYYYIVSFMLIPVTYGPIIMKVILELAAVGYSVYRTKCCYGRRAGYVMYVLFLLYPVIAYTTSAHRLPVYFLVYLMLFEKLLFDRLEKKDLTPFGIVMMLLTGAVLTQWRTEGIYLLVLVPVLMFMVYPRLRKRRAAAALILGYLLVQYFISIPQNLSAQDLAGAANDRMKPFYAYTITNMYRNGLDTAANESDLEIVDGYISVDAIEKINEHYGDINYEDVLILIDESFGGVREDAGYGQYYDFTGAVKRIMINNPGVFLATRWGAFCYSALPYHITFSGYDMRALAAFAVSVVKTVSYNLFIPVIFVLSCCIYCLIRRRWYTFFVTAGLCAHLAIVFVLAPASYFKYYFPVYIMAYFYMILLIAVFLQKRKDGVSSPVI